MAVQNEQLLQTKKFRMHGSAAYDVNATREFPAVRVKLPPDVAPEPTQTVKKSAEKPENRVSAFAVLVFSATLFMLILAVFSALQLIQTEGRIGALREKLAAERSEHTRLEQKFSETVDLKAIRVRAEAMGMQPLSKTQLRHLEVSGADHAEITPVRGILIRIADAIRAGVQTVLEYLS